VYVQLVTFGLNGPTEDQYLESCREELDIFAALPGLLGKIWLRDPETGTFGGLYLWRDRASYDDYIAGDVFNTMAEDANLKDFRSRGFDHYADLTRATQPGLTVSEDRPEAVPGA
jgi:hypothetical protein